MSGMADPFADPVESPESLGVVGALVSAMDGKQITHRLNRSDQRVSRLDSRLDRTTVAVGRLDHRMDIRDQQIDEALDFARAAKIAIPVGVLAWTILVVCGVLWVIYG